MGGAVAVRGVSVHLRASAPACVCVCDLTRPDPLSGEEIRGLVHGEIYSDPVLPEAWGLSLALLEAHVNGAGLRQVGTAQRALSTLPPWCSAPRSETGPLPG